MHDDSLRSPSDTMEQCHQRTKLPPGRSSTPRTTCRSGREERDHLYVRPSEVTYGVSRFSSDECCTTSTGETPVTQRVHCTVRACTQSVSQSVNLAGRRHLIRCVGRRSSVVSRSSDHVGRTVSGLNCGRRIELGRRDRSMMDGLTPLRRGTGPAQ